MEWYFALALMLGAVCLLMAIGLPVAFSFIVANIVGAWIFMGGEAGVTAVMRSMLSGIANFGLAPIPLFIFMGEILFQTGVAFTDTSAASFGTRINAGNEKHHRVAIMRPGSFFRHDRR